MEQEFIRITKKPGKKDCVRINNVTDIPDFLKDAIQIYGQTIILDCLEG